MKKKGEKVVMLRPKHDRRAKKDISEEPAMRKLKSMIRDGKVDPARTVEFLKSEKED